MADEKPWYSPERKPPAARQPQPGKHLWTLRRDQLTMRYELRQQPVGCELQQFLDGELLSARLYPSEEIAYHAADARRRAAIAQGWMPEQL